MAIFLFWYGLISVTNVYSQCEKEQLEFLPKSEFFNSSRLKFWQPSSVYPSEKKLLHSYVNKFRYEFHNNFMSGKLDEIHNFKRNRYRNTFARQIILANNTTDNSVNNSSNNSSYELKPFHKTLGMIRSDFTNFYLSRENLFCLGLGLTFHAAISNTTIDQSLRNWYQNEVRSSGTDDLSYGFKFFGEGYFLIPFFGITTGVYCIDQKFLKSCKVWGVAGDYSTRVLRSYVIGLPTLLLFQSMLGCSRPDEKSHHSAWRFFRDNNSLSGHAFIGATPFLVAASMTDRLGLKVILFICSTFAGLSRINDDAHYFSQVALGWYLSYLSVRAVTKTNNTFSSNNSNIKFFPILESKYIGLGFVFKR